MNSFSKSLIRLGAKLPAITLFMGAVPILLYFFSDTAALLQYDRGLIADGEVWRCITGHWTHWSLDHLAWCSITFIAVGAICEQLDRKRFLIAIAASALIIPVISWFAAPSMLFYRGLSGICSGIFILAAAMMIQKALAAKDWLNLILPAFAGFLFFTKLLFEFISGQTVFVHSTELFSPVPLTHLTGGIIGLITATRIAFKSGTPTQ